MLWFVLFLAYVFEFANGWTDAPNSIATVVSTRVMRPHHAVMMAGVLNLVGALAGTAVAKTIAEGIVDLQLRGSGDGRLRLVGRHAVGTRSAVLRAPVQRVARAHRRAARAGFAAGGLKALESEGTNRALIGWSPRRSVGSWWASC